MASWLVVATVLPIVTLMSLWQSRGRDAVGFHQVLAIWLITCCGGVLFGMHAVKQPFGVISLLIGVALAPPCFRILWEYRIPHAMRRRADDDRLAARFMAIVALAAGVVAVAGVWLAVQPVMPVEDFSIAWFLAAMVANVGIAVTTSWLAWRLWRSRS